MTTKPYQELPRQRTKTYTCSKCDLIFKLDIHDSESRKIKHIYCPVCQEKVK